MRSNTVLVVSAVVAILTTKSLGAVRFPPKGSTELPIEITTVKPSALPTNLSGRGNAASGQSRKTPDNDSKGTAYNDNEIDRLDTAATYHSPPTQIQGFGNGNAHDLYSTFYGHQPFILNGRGFPTADSLLQVVLATNFPYLATPYLYVGPCSLECEYFSVQHRNAFPFFPHSTGSRPLHDLAEYQGPHYNTPGFQPNRFPYATLGHNRPEQDGAHQNAGGQVRYPTDGRDVNHIKTPPHLLQSRINGQYASQK